jgi:hypothetical protein
MSKKTLVEKNRLNWRGDVYYRILAIFFSIKHENTIGKPGADLPPSGPDKPVG